MNFNTIYRRRVCREKVYSFSWTSADGSSQRFPHTHMCHAPFRPLYLNGKCISSSFCAQVQRKWALFKLLTIWHVSSLEWRLIRLQIQIQLQLHSCRYIHKIHLLKITNTVMNAKTVSHSQGHKHNKPIRIHRDTVTDAVPAQRYKIQLHILIQLHIHIHMYIDTAFTSGLIVMSIAYNGRLETK